MPTDKDKSKGSDKPKSSDKADKDKAKRNEDDSSKSKKQEDTHVEDEVSLHPDESSVIPPQGRDGPRDALKHRTTKQRKEEAPVLTMDNLSQCLTSIIGDKLAPLNETISSMKSEIDHLKGTKKRPS